MRGVKTMAPPTTMNLLTLDESETAALVERLGWPAYRTGQILRWLYQRRARTISQMTDLSQADRATLEREARIGRSLGCTVFRSADGTRKLILKLEDELEVEAVLIPDDERLTLCVSTQVGNGVEAQSEGA
jgi:23S rRNA (adenine2503-C2)-methyltransferase